MIYLPCASEIMFIQFKRVLLLDAFDFYILIDNGICTSLNHQTLTKTKHTTLQYRKILFNKSNFKTMTAST